MEIQDRLTQRLDHMVPDITASDKANREAARQLELISNTLYDLLPDRSLSPLERLERLARAAEDRNPDLEQLQPATKKVAALKARLAELVPGDKSAHEKLADLADKIDELVSVRNKHLPMIAKLEILGDPRGGVEPE